MYDNTFEEAVMIVKGKYFRGQKVISMANIYQNEQLQNLAKN
jgi:hypothetical protein